MRCIALMIAATCLLLCIQTGLAESNPLPGRIIIDR